MADVLIIGAGPVGLMAAWRLARSGAEVTLLDDGRTPAGHVAAGMLGPWSEAEHRDGPMHSLMVASSRSWPEIAGELATASRCEVGFVDCGTLFVAARPEQIAALRRHGETIGTLDSPPQWQTGTTLRVLEPGLGPDVSGGFAMEHEHQVDPRQALEALRAACVNSGVTTIHEAAVELATVDERVAGAVTASGVRVEASSTALCGGWSCGKIATRVPLRPVKGQILRLGVPSGEALPIGRVVRSADAYLAPRHGEVVVGGTVEEASDTRVTAGALWRLLEEAGRLVPDTRELEFREAAAGLRPATADGLPAIGRDSVDGLIWATGAFRHGILLSPVMAEAVLDSVEGKRPSELVESFTPERFVEAV